jgi:Tol biopolymer transport system component
MGPSLVEVLNLKPASVKSVSLPFTYRPSFWVIGPRLPLTPTKRVKSPLRGTFRSKNGPTPGADAPSLNDSQSAVSEKMSNKLTVPPIICKMGGHAWERSLHERPPPAGVELGAGQSALGSVHCWRAAQASGRLAGSRRNMGTRQTQHYLRARLRPLYGGWERGRRAQDCSLAWSSISPAVVSPDGASLRFTVYDSRTGLKSLWALTPNQRPAHPLFSEDQSQRDECCGVWTADGKYFVYQSTQDHVTNLWAIRQDDSSGAVVRNPIRLSTGPIDFLGPSPSPDGQRVFAIGQQKRGELMRYDRAAGRFVSWLSGLSAEGLDFSRDGSRMAWTSYPEAALWRSRADGGDRTQLTPPGMVAFLPRWSPDGRQILFTGSKAGRSFKAYVISAAGGNPHTVVPGGGPEFDAGWSSDGRSLVYADSVTAPSGGIHLVDIQGQHASMLAGSEGLFSPRWSPNGRFIAALTKDSLSLPLLDTRTGRWRNLVQGRHVTYQSWSRDSQWIYFCSPLV